jgi:hypothetical protein
MRGYDALANLDRDRLRHRPGLITTARSTPLKTALGGTTTTVTATTDAGAPDGGHLNAVRVLKLGGMDPIPPLIAGVPVTVIGEVTAADLIAPTGTVQFVLDGLDAGTIDLTALSQLDAGIISMDETNGTSVGSFTLGGLAAGMHTISGTYGGDKTHAASSASVTAMVSPAPTGDDSGVDAAGDDSGVDAAGDDAGVDAAGNDAGVDAAGDDSGVDATVGNDSGVDATVGDDSGVDATLGDDSGVDATLSDTGTDGGLADAGFDATVDAGPPTDAGTDTGSPALDGGTTPDLSNGRYVSGEVWDCQRSPAFPAANQTFKVSGFNTPYADNGKHVTIATGQWIAFGYVGGTCTDPPSMTETLYNSDGTVNQVLSTGGAIWGLGSQGFLYVSTHGFGTFISNGAIFSQGGSLTYTPTTAQASCAEIAAYQASH